MTEWLNLSTATRSYIDDMIDICDCGRSYKQRNGKE